jgi:hypothetical protein
MLKMVVAPNVGIVRLVDKVIEFGEFYRRFCLIEGTKPDTIAIFGLHY